LEEDLLPVGYFHVVFTIPEELNYITLTNQKEMYSILFKSVSETLLELSIKFRGKFLFHLKRAYYSNALKYSTGIEELTKKHIFQSFIDKLYKKEWIVYCR
jgi:hypothetical protein